MTPSALCSGCCQIQPRLILSRIEDPDTESTYFAEEVTRVGAQIYQLIELQTILLRRQNQHCSAIYTLPLELLVAIFLLSSVCERATWNTLGEPNSQVRVLSSVSSYWREVVLQTPRLWNTVALDVNGRTSETAAGLLQQHLIHAKSLDISLDLTLGRRGEKTNTFEYQPIANVLFALESTQDVTTLRVKNLPVEWLVKLSQLPRLHTLVLEHLRNEYNAPVTFDFHTLPLRRLSLSFDGDRSRCRWGPVSLPSSIQVLWTSGIAPGILLVFLHQCPNVTKVVQWDYSKSWNDSSFLTAPLTLSRLETLTLLVGDFLDLTSVHNFSLPALKHLRLNEGLDDMSVPVITFCHQFSETLTSLELHWFCYWEASDFEWLFHKMEHLEILRLTQWPLTDLVRAILALTPSDEEFRRHELKSLPSLQSLVLTADLWATDTGDTSDGPDDHLASVYALLPRHSNNCADDMIHLFLEFLEKRRAGELASFHLDLPVLWSIDQELVWSDDLRNKLRHTIEGRRIKILQNRLVLKWL